MIVLGQFLRLPGPVTDPVPVFLILTAVLLVAPLLFEKLRLPGIIGLLVAGVVVGPKGVGLLERDSTIVLLGTVGLLFLMFMAGLETSLDDLRARMKDSLVFGAATFLLPMGLGTVAMLAVGYGVLSSVLLASCFASHTLLALPLLFRLGIVRSRASLATLGATLITNILALLVLGIVVRAHAGRLDLLFWLSLLPTLALFTSAIVLGIPVLGRWFFRTFGHDEGAEFTFVLVTLLVASYSADLLEIEPIIGAFLAGTAITGLIPAMSPLMSRIQFIGNTLFIPFFLLSVGMLVDPSRLTQPRTLVVSAAMVGAVMGTKFLAAWLAGKVLGLERDSRMVMFGLSVAQAASTLAAATVGFEVGLLDETSMNGIIAMIMVTCLVSPWVTARWGERVHSEPPTSGPAAAAPAGRGPDRVLVPVANPETEKELLELAILLAGRAGGALLPMNVAVDRGERVPLHALETQRKLLSRAVEVANAAAVQVEPIPRLASSVERGVLHAAFERRATLILCGWRGYSSVHDNFFGGILERLVRGSWLPVLVGRLSRPVRSVSRVLLLWSADLPLGALEPALSRASAVASGLKARLVLLAREPLTLPAWFSGEVQVEPHDLLDAVSRLVGEADLLILPICGPLRPFAGGLLGAGAEELARSRPELDLVILYLPDPEHADVRFPVPVQS